MEQMKIIGEYIATMHEDVALVGDYAVIADRADIGDLEIEYPPAPVGINMALPEPITASSRNFRPVVDEALKLLGVLEERGAAGKIYGDGYFDEGTRNAYADIPRLLGGYEREDCASEVLKMAAEAGFWIRQIEFYKTNGSDLRMLCEREGFGFGGDAMIGFAWMAPEDLERRYGGDPDAAEAALDGVIEKMNDYDQGLFDIYELKAAPVIDSDGTTLDVGESEFETITDRIYGDDELNAVLEEITPADVKYALENGDRLDSFGRQEFSMRM